MSDYVQFDPTALRSGAEEIRDTGDGFRTLAERVEAVCGPWVMSGDPARASFGRSIAPSVAQIEEALNGLEGFCGGLADAVVVAADNYAAAQDSAAQDVAGVAASADAVDTGGAAPDDDDDEDEGYVTPGTGGRR